MSRRSKRKQTIRAATESQTAQTGGGGEGLTTRRLARAAVGVVLAVALAVAGVILLTPEPQSAVQAILVNCGDPPPEPGPARPWEADVPVSTYSSVNTRTRNLFTAIPIVSWSGRGPGMSMALYHNSANVDLPASRTDNVGFSLGSGWSVAYSDQLLLDDPQNPTEVTVVYADGTEDVFTWGAGTGAWFPPDGEFDRIEVDSATDTWTVTHKDQSRYTFARQDALDDGIYRLAGIYDAVGAATTVDYEAIPGEPSPYPYRVTKITGAGRDLMFAYDTGGKLETITDPSQAGELGIPERAWTFYYDTNDRLEKLKGPMDYYNHFLYDNSGRLSLVTDKVDYATGNPVSMGPDSYKFWYANDHGVTIVQDPDSADPDDGLYQQFDTICGDAVYLTTYFDRRGAASLFTYNLYVQRQAPDGNKPWPEGNLHRIWRPGIGTWFDMYYDGDRNLDGFYDELNHGWTATYDDSGNMEWRFETVVSGTQEWTYHWQYDGFNNLTHYTDPAGNTTQFEYRYSAATDSGSCSGDSPNVGGLCGVCSGGPGDGLPCDGLNCPGGTCVLDDTPCRLCDESSTHPFDPCTDDTDCPGGTCVGSCHATVIPPQFPTLLTKVIEPADGQGNPAAETVLTYDGKEQLDTVTDPNGVVTRFDYDEFGQPSRYAEGDNGGADVFYETYVYDGGSRMINNDGIVYTPGCTGGTASSCPGGSTYNAANNRKSSKCPCLVIAGGAPGQGSSEIDLPCFAPSLPAVFAEIDPDEAEAEYDPMGRLTKLPAVLTVQEDSASTTYRRTRMMAYDNLGRPTLDQVTTTELGLDSPREFSYAYDTGGGTITRTGTDGVDTLVSFDAAGLVDYMRRGAPGSSVAEVDYQYYDNGLTLRATYYKSDGTSVNSYVDYFYYDNNLLRLIEHRDPGGLLTWSYEYAYDDVGAPASITESDWLGIPRYVTDFTYDNRGRLIEEKRYDDTLPEPLYAWQHEYWYRYAYDNGGNRTHKFDDKNIREWRYTYDVHEPLQYTTANNRLMMAVEYAGQGEGANPSKSTWYFYNCGGNVTRIVSRDGIGGGMQNMAAGGGTLEPEGFGGGETTGFRGGLGCGFQSTQYTAVRFGYAKNGRTVTYAMGEKWCNADGLGCEDTGSYEVTWAKEFRYDGARQRYLERELDPTDLESEIITEISKTVTDYDGDEPYLSWVRPLGGSAAYTGYELGIARIDDPNGTPSTEYYHTDMIGTTRFLTDGAGGVVDAASYTAFGELVTGTSDRFGYVGEWGYQTHDEMPYQHVGARYYDSSAGRFLQRDEAGIWGGLNVYEYVDSAPTIWVDPSGLKGRNRYGYDDHSGHGAFRAACGLFNAMNPKSRVGDPDQVFADPPRRERPGIPKPKPPRKQRPPTWHSPVHGGTGIGCFVAGTVVQRFGRQVPIEDIKMGDLVVSSDPVGETTSESRISHVHVAYANELFHVALAGETIVCTSEHPFWVHGGGWTKARDLQPGFDLVSFDGSLIPILGVSVKKLAMPVPVYNITVESTETYFIGESRILVHNKMG